MGRKTENTGFTCKNCSRVVAPLKRGTYRNHCPFCLYSLHVDVEPGDRQSECMGLMKPASVKYNSQKGYQILHCCTVCGFSRYNIIARDEVEPDDMKVVFELMKNGDY